MELAILSYEGVGPIKFGMTQAEVRQAVSEAFETFLKSETSEMPTDFFSGIGVFVYYKSPGRCEAVEMAAPASPTFRGTSLIGRPFSDVLTTIIRADPEAKLHSSGLKSLALGLGIYAPGGEEEPDTIVEGVIAFEKGYYD